MGRDLKIRPIECGFKEFGSGKNKYARLGVSGEKDKEENGEMQFDEGEGTLRETLSSSGREDGKETEDDQSSDEEGRSETGSSSTVEWIRRKREDPTPSIQVVKCLIEGDQAEN